MTPEELMRPRYKVIDKWPGMHVEPFYVGQIVTLQSHKEEDAEGFIYVPNKHIPGSFMWQSFFDLYENLFKELNWWEYRKPHEMPEYVKCIDDGVLYKISQISSSGEKFIGIGGTGGIWTHFRHFLPATLAEYETYINQSNEYSNN